MADMDGGGGSLEGLYEYELSEEVRREMGFKRYARALRNATRQKNGMTLKRWVTLAFNEIFCILTY
jgi:hypothetical protein